MARKPREVSYLEIRNWAKYQHYKDRRPPWVKLHGELLDDYEWIASDYRSRLLAVLLLILSGRLDNLIPNDSQWIAGQVAMRTADVKAGIERLLEISFLQAVPDPVSASNPASEPLAPVLANVLADRKQDASAHVRPRARGETETYGAEAETEREVSTAKAVSPELTVMRNILTYANTTLGHKWKLTDSRKAKIRARLREGYTTDQLKAVIDGALLDPWEFRSVNNNDDPVILFRDSTHVDRFLAFHNTPINGNGASLTSKQIRALADQMEDA